MNGYSCEIVNVFETEHVSTWGGIEPPTFGFMPNVLTCWAIRAWHLLSHVYEHWLWRYIYVWSKVNIWNVNCARTTAFIFDTRTVVLVKVSTFLRQKMSRPEGPRAPNLRIHAECSNLLIHICLCIYDYIHVCWCRTMIKKVKLLVLHRYVLSVLNNK